MAACKFLWCIRNSTTCLRVAARDGYSQVINLLEAHGAELNFQNDHGHSAFIIAVQYGQEWAVLKLLQIGADKFIKTKMGKTAADMDKIFKQPEIGITDPEGQKKILCTPEQMHLDEVDVDTMTPLNNIDGGSEDFLNFLISLKQQCWYLTETVQDIISRFPRSPSKVVLTCDPKKEAQAICTELVTQTGDPQKKFVCIKTLLVKTNHTEYTFRHLQPNSNIADRGKVLRGLLVCF